MQRFTVSIEPKLAAEFDALIERRAYGNRSEAFRDLLRAELERQRDGDDPQGWCVACLSYVYNHHERDLAERLNDLQHAHHDLTVSTISITTTASRPSCCVGRPWPCGDLPMACVPNAACITVIST